MTMAEDPLPKQTAEGSVIAQASGGSTATIIVYQSQPTPDSQNRKQMLANVRAFWIAGVLEQSLQEAAYIALGLREQSDIVIEPLRQDVPEAARPARSLPPGTPIKQVYQDAGGFLLILGEPGAGKTILLLELTSDLLDDAQQDATHPIPVVFNLSSWANRQQPLGDWLVEELQTKYQVPGKVAQTWVENNSILSLLDGLDEVRRAAREECIKAINAYRQEHGLVPTVVCCRYSDYLELGTRLHLRRAVIVQPPSAQQVDDYLRSAGEKLASMRVALHEDPALQELASTPLMLSVLTLAYHDKPIETILEGEPVEIQQRQVFAHYVERMLKRKGGETGYTPQQTIHWLKWLARALKRHNQAEFHIERMQLDWLSADPSSHYGIIVGLIYGFLTFFVQWITYANFFGPPILEPNMRLLVGLLAGVVLGLVMGVPGKLTASVQAAETVAQPPGRLRGSLLKLLGNRFIVGLIYGLLNGVVVGLVVGLTNWGGGLYGGLLFGSIFVVFFWLGFTVLGKIELEIKPTEVVTWSWRGFRRELIASLRNGLAIGSGLVVGAFVVLYWLDFSTPSFLQMLGDDLPVALPLGALAGLDIVLLVVVLRGLFGGLSNERLKEHGLLKPNEGIWRSARKSARTGLMVGVIVTLAMVPFFKIFNDRSFYVWQLSPPIISNALIIGLIFGLLAGLRSGGIACMQHVYLRWLLWDAGRIPWNYPRFLDYAAERILLRKVGGGYIFIHSELRDYFASLDEHLAPNVYAGNASVSHQAALGGEPTPASLALGLASPPHSSDLPTFRETTSSARHIAFDRKLPGRRTKILIGVVALLVASVFIGQTAYQTHLDQINAQATAAAAAANPYPTYLPGHGTFAFYDPLSQPDQWHERKDDSYGGACQFVNEAYHIRLSNPNILYSCYARLVYSNFVFEVQMKILHGDCGGITFRGAPATYAGYAFRVCENGSAALLKFDSNGDASILWDSIFDPDIHEGLNHSNLLAILAQADTIALYVNRQQIASVPDDSYSEGLIGLVADEHNGPTEVVYDNARVWTL